MDMQWSRWVGQHLPPSTRFLVHLANGEEIVKFFDREMWDEISVIAFLKIPMFSSNIFAETDNKGKAVHLKSQRDRCQKFLWRLRSGADIREAEIDQVCAFARHEIMRELRTFLEIACMAELPEDYIQAIETAISFQEKP